MASPPRLPYVGSRLCLQKAIIAPGLGGLGAGVDVLAFRHGPSATDAWD
ncbi:hypothetical protein GFS31_27590 [Leptolyngbya sp. BL0902]|nr:hypothetical protein GFS31_27590 [Leptolyngbya sp. BL0902]